MSEAALTERAPILRFLRVGLHVVFAGLLLLGLGRSLSRDDPHQAVIVAVAGLLAVVYVIGTAAEYRASTRTGATVSRRLAWLWLGVVTAVWGMLLVLSPEFVWLAFPLMFLYLAVLPTGPGIVAVVVLWLACWLVPAQHTATQAPVTFGAVVGPGIGAIVAVLISLAYRQLQAEAIHHRRVAEALRAAQTELITTERQAGQVAERERLAREIHDTLAQGLSSILLLARAGLRQTGLPEPSRAALETIEQTATDNLAEARRFVRHLSEPGERVGLAEALDALVSRYRTEMQVRDQPLRCEVRWDGEGSAATLPEPVVEAVLRTVQVGLGNVAAHARAQTCVITVSVWDAEVTVDIFDDGVGFEPAATKPSDGSGWGLIGLRRRIGSLGGQVWVESGADAGTVLAVRIPRTAQIDPEHDHSDPGRTGPDQSDPTGGRR